VDCCFPENWSRNLTAPFEYAEVHLVAGPVASEVNGSGFLQRFQQVEWFSILLMTQFSFSRNQPLTCSGANLAFRKSTFIELGGYSGNEQILSGDDEFLLKKIIEKFGAGSCIYLPTREALVMTSAQSTWSNLVKQRIRWAGKWKVHRSFSHGFSAILAFCIQLVWIYSFYIFFQSSATYGMLCLIWAVKIISEYYSLGKVGHSLGFRRDGLGFLLTSLAHPFYVVCVGLGTVFFKVSWKGRTQEVSVI
jgi:cellulose synthase/poly-beta-1,6-N-acetylglucosamine synthase-like glycosyltransferase